MTPLFFRAKYTWSQQPGAVISEQIWAKLPQQPCPCGPVGWAVGGSPSQGSGVSWPLEPFPQGSNKNLCAVASGATCRVWPGAGPPPVGSSGPRIAQGFSDRVPRACRGL